MWLSPLHTHTHTNTHTHKHTHTHIHAHTHRFMVSSLIDSRLTSTPSFPTQALLASNIYKVFLSISPLRFHFVSITSHFHLCHGSSHTHATFLFHLWYSNAVITFDTSPYPQQYYFQVHSATAQQQKHITIWVRFLHTCFSIHVYIYIHSYIHVFPRQMALQ